MRKKNKALSPILLFLIFSMLLHIGAGTGIFLFEKYGNYQRTFTEPITISIMETPSNNTLESSVKTQQEDIKNAKQIVEQNVENDEEFNKSAELLSAKNYKTKKQTIAQARGDFQNIKSRQQKGREIVSNSKGVGSPTSEKKSLPQNSSLKNLQVGSLIPTLGVGDFRVHDAQKMVREESVETPVDQSPGGGGAHGQGAQGQGAEVSQTQDYLKNVDKGLETLLNTREFKYYSYYNRIRRQLSEHWEGIVRERVMRIYKEGRTIASSQDRITKLLVVLNSAGLLVNVQVLSDSGVQDLDEAAIDAFRSAAPFPNPPKGIVETDGTVRIRWDMVLET